jgi:hypothetical protein
LASTVTLPFEGGGAPTGAEVPGTVDVDGGTPDETGGFTVVELPGTVETEPGADSTTVSVRPTSRPFAARAEFTFRFTFASSLLRMKKNRNNNTTPAITAIGMTTHFGSVPSRCTGTTSLTTGIDRSGLPQTGHATAASDTSFPHSGQTINDISLPSQSSDQYELLPPFLCIFRSKPRNFAPHTKTQKSPAFRAILKHFQIV